LIEKGKEIADSVREWGHVVLFSPWSLNMSQVGRQILSEMSCSLPAAESFPTGKQFVEQYLDILAKWLHNCGKCQVHLNSEALAIGRGLNLFTFNIILISAEK
jgi:hypothetical protein